MDSVRVLSTFLRAVRDLTVGERAGPARGPEAAGAPDVFVRRPVQWRNQTWEAGHVQAPLVADADGELVRPWVTWSIDVATKAITGTAVTPGHPSRTSILAALRAAGGIPERVRVDRGRDFLSRTSWARSPT
ncbi:hypothetical protein EF912_14475 [Streptomyces sp. WAC07061]|uniref:hypothetical protein n=1 Tax=Streptomyces sp. WAC07061 TaxID=2487410 RepID=UPI000F76F2C9|nr:hypothetical protein [Streptomyces sp. WAC07061]RSS56256.1 hypothetical protein EF912_14475 [Streptomyces sp. WAC07061]